MAFLAFSGSIYKPLFTPQISSTSNNKLHCLTSSSNLYSRICISPKGRSIPLKGYSIKTGTSRIKFPFERSHLLIFLKKILSSGICSMVCIETMASKLFSSNKFSFIPSPAKNETLSCLFKLTFVSICSLE